ncbi:unnamed protein product [Owenia fusiformis]|uniref:Uncharacterized protein n=1 Tax=Owenia fusiformis TaxID=6347 RepID=A0A8J1TR80_OWEFU|nr:unnamed protein product [Owenia fusiformis]
MESGSKEDLALVLKNARANHQFYSQQQAPLQQEANGKANSQNGDVYDGYQSEAETRRSDNRPQTFKTHHDEDDPDKEDVLGSLYENAISEAGFGKFQWTLLFVLGLGIMGDGIELYVVAFILPGAEKDLCMTSAMKGWLGSVGFAGMLVGSLVWGSIADRIGRKPSLLLSLSINAIFSLVCAFMLTFELFVMCRFICGFGIGGSIPITVAYFLEFCPRQRRGRHIGMLLLWWTMAGLYVSIAAWIIIPYKELAFHIMGSDFHSWRICLIVCAIPCLASVIGLFFMPESPRYLLEVGKDLKALSVFRQVYLWNHAEDDSDDEYEMPEIRIPNNMPASPSIQNEKAKNCFHDCQSKFKNICSSFRDIFGSSLIVTTLILTVTWSALTFGYYGMTIWFPEYMKKLQMEAYFRTTEYTANSTVLGANFTHQTDNMEYDNVMFDHVTFYNIILTHVTFQNCTFLNCIFKNVTSAKTSFLSSSLYNVTFTHTDFVDAQFQNTHSRNVYFAENMTGCAVDFDINYSARQVYFENFLGQLAVLPGGLVVAFLVDFVGRIRLLAGSMFLCGISVFFIWLLDRELGVVILNCVFMLLGNISWNTLEIISGELYPSRTRGTGLGYLSCISRVAAVLGNVSFGNLIDISKFIPILLTASVMAIGGLVSTKLTDSRDIMI